MTRIRGSVPDLRTSTRPEPFSLASALAKAAMTEGLADAWLRATPALERLYRTWSEGGSGLLITGNVQVDRFDLERPGNVAIDQSEPRTFDAEARARLAAWAKAGTAGGGGGGC